MDSSIKGNFKYPIELKTFRSCHNEVEVIGGLMRQLSAQMKSLQAVQTCLSVGTGYGDFDIEFIKLCLPNLKKLISIERDHNCVEELKENLSYAFGYKIDVEIHEMSIEKFVESSDENLHKELDIVLAFHSLYFLTPNDRIGFFKLCFNFLLKPNTGSLVVVNCIQGNPLSKLRQKLNLKLCSNMEEIEEEIKSVGLMPVHEVSYKFKIDARNHQDALYNLLMLSNQVTKEEFLKALEVVSTDGILEQKSKLCVFEGN